MMRRYYLPSQFLLAISLAATVCQAVIFHQSRGAWPEDWPKELEPLRETSRTIGVGTGIRENIYEIPVPDRDTFERIWPAILRLRTPGGPLTLYRAGSPPPKKWGDVLSNKEPAIRIYGPSGSYSSKGAAGPQDPPDFKKLVEKGRALVARGPWPRTIVGKNDELPQYVTSEEGKDGRLVWVPGDPFHDKDEGPHGVYYRARIDVELVVDGKTINLNRVELPDGVTVIDHRFDDEH